MRTATCTWVFLLCLKNGIGFHTLPRFLTKRFANDKSKSMKINLDMEIDKVPKKRYPLTKPSFIEEMRRLNSNNKTVQNNAILNGMRRKYNDDSDDSDDYDDNDNDSEPTYRIVPVLGLRLELEKQGTSINDDDDDDVPTRGFFEEDDETHRRSYVERKKNRSKNFEVIKTHHVNFTHVGGYASVKEELSQCIDILKNYPKYLKYNVRVPKGLMLEGPPGTGKTLLAKALAGEARCSFIAVSGSDFGEKYVGVGTSRVKELFALAKDNLPCIIFIDEVDALARSRVSDGELSSAERESTLNALLVEMDGFKNNTGVFIVAATNRIDLLDKALMRPGRIDKTITIGFPDKETREAILKIHATGKPRDTKNLKMEDLVEMTENFSGAQIENLLNEAMLNALKRNKTAFDESDLETVLNKILTGFQPMKLEFTSDMVLHIAIHEMGHAMMSIFSRYHSKAVKVVINLSSPKSYGYTMFTKLNNNGLTTREVLFEHLMVLLAGRVAEEVFYNVSITTGAREDFREALEVAYDMVINYGMGSALVYPRNSEKYKELIDDDVLKLIKKAHQYARKIISQNKQLIYELSLRLQKEKMLKLEDIQQYMREKYDNDAILNSVVEVPFLELLE